METLEARWVFSAAPVAVVTEDGACLPDSEPVPVAEPEGEAQLVAPLPVGPAYPVTADQSTQLPLAPATADQFFTELAAEDQPEGEYGYSYYLHIDMISVPMGDREWNFSGRVTINGPVGEVKVVFGGLLEGHETSVDQYGEFSYTHQFTAGTYGQITGQAFGSEGYSSNIDVEFIMA